MEHIGRRDNDFNVYDTAYSSAKRTQPVAVLLGKADHGGEAAPDLLPQLAAGDPASAAACGAAASVRVAGG